MKIYTKQGDSGETGLFGGSRVPKDDLRIQAYGTLDELNAALGLAIASLTGTSIAERLSPALTRVQGELFQLGAELATPKGKKLSMALIDETQVAMLEREIDEMQELIPPLKSFILPGGSIAASHLHLARTISRRAERELVTLNRTEAQRPVLLHYLNRLSDYLFVTARFSNHLFAVSDVAWIPKL